MRLIYSFLLSLLALNLPLQAAPLDNLTLANGCRLFQLDGFNFKTFPGSMCLFLDDGNLISANENAIRLFNPKNEVVWEIKGHFHHQINLTNDKKSILALSSAVSAGPEGARRQDKVMIISLDGKVLHEKLADDIFTEAKSSPTKMLIDPHMRYLFGSGHEISHLNSIYAIPENKNEKKYPYLKAGNIIINGLQTGIHILNSDLSKVVKYIELKKHTIAHAIHDVQVTPEGNILLFNNAVLTHHKIYHTHPNWRSFNNLHSAIQEFKIPSLTLVKKFETDPVELFYSKACGSIQEIDSDTWLFTHIVSGTYVYSKSKKKVIQSISATHLNDHQFIPTQQVKAWDLRKFLSHWK